MSNETKKTRNRTMSLQQRLICEFFKEHPESTRRQCAEGVTVAPEGVPEKIASLVKSGHLVSIAGSRPEQFKLTGKQFPPSDEYEPCAKRIVQRMREEAGIEYRVAVLDVIAAAFHAMVSVGRASA
ncbi:hypothetical protein [Paraburkholderia azotifigens]|uniref:hypothetical protein n=1 Tax=Paraburkholderia azotifigens TaxID=2057004 RepID=UPI0038B8A373